MTKQERTVTFVGGGRMTEQEPALPLTLPLRQRQVLVGLAGDLSTKQIAYRHHISERTVMAHTAVLKTKLNCCKLTGLVAEAIRLNLITPVETETGVEWKASN